MDEWERVRRLVLGRDGYKCLRCLGEASDVHHRRPKGMGGTSDKRIKYGMANLVSLCRECHSWIHAHPAQSYKTGYLVHSWDDPADVPLTIKPGTWMVKLTADGDTEKVGDYALF